MALGPKNIKLTEDDLNRIERLEKQIDDQLRRRYTSGHFSLGITVCPQRGQTDTKCNGDRVRAELKKRFMEAGWSKVEFTDDQCDGEFIRLTP